MPLKQLARHVVVPKGAVTTGWPAVRDTLEQIRWPMDHWQKEIGRAGLAKNAEGLYAAAAIVLSIARQVGKTHLVGGIIVALCLINRRTLVLWTAHRYSTAEDTFNDIKSMIEKTPALRRKVKKIYDSSGKQRIVFHNGSRIVFGARERGFGRGWKKVAVLVFDEAQILTPNAVDDMVPATNRHPNPLIFYMGTPPKPSDPSDHFAMLRAEAIGGESEDTFYVEFSADPDADPRDREQWAKANPSFPHHTPVRSMQRMLKNLGPESFLREALGIWNATSSSGIFTIGAWARCRVTPLGPNGEPLNGDELDAYLEDYEPPAPSALAISSDVDGIWLSLGSVSQPDLDGKRHLGSVLRVRADQDRQTFIEETKRIQDKYRIPVAIDVKGPAAYLIEDLEAAAVELTRTGIDDLVQASADIRELVEKRCVTHLDYPELNAGVDVASWRSVGGDRRALSRKKGDVSMLEAVAIALRVAEIHDNYDPLSGIR